MHFPTYKTLSTAVLVSGTLATIPMVHGAPARFSVQPRLSPDDSNTDFITAPVPQPNWRTGGPGNIQVQRGHQNPLRFGQKPTTLPDAYKRPRVMDHQKRARMEVNTADRTPTPDTWAEGWLFEKFGLEPAEIELLEYAINKRAEISAPILDDVNETGLGAPYNIQNLNVLFSNPPQGELGIHEEQASRTGEAAKTLKKAALKCLEFSKALQHDELSTELEAEKTDQDLTVVLSNMAKDDNFVEMVGLGMVKLVEEEKKASAAESEIFSEVTSGEL